MKTVRIKRIALLLALLMLAVLFAGCGSEPAQPAQTSGNTPGTRPVTVPQTEPETEPVTEAPHEHVAEEDYRVDTEPNCRTAGSKSIHCSLCGKTIEGTEVEIPAEPDNHVIDPFEAVEIPAAFWKTGSRSAVCLVCGETITEELEMSTPGIYNSAASASERAELPYASGGQFMTRAKTKDVGYIEPFFPTDENPEGYDFLVEFSLLWNETLRGLGGDLTVMHIEDYNLFNINLGTGLISSRERTGDVYVYPSEADVRLDPTLKSVSIGEYGWHRIGVRMHQTAEIVEGKLVQTYIATLYLDGEMILQVDKSVWVLEGDYGKGRTVSDARLYIPEIINDTLFYSDNLLHNEARICHESFFNDGVPAYLVIADVFFTAGHDFVEQVKPAILPVAGDDFQVSETVSLPAARYFVEVE